MPVPANYKYGIFCWVCEYYENAYCKLHNVSVDRHNTCGEWKRNFKAASLA